jgi:hypothetical protein
MMTNWLQTLSHRLWRRSTALPADAEADMSEQLGRALWSVPVPPGTRERVWATIDRRTVTADRPYTSRSAGVWGIDRRSARLLAATSLVVVAMTLGGLSPAGQQAIALAKETITITLFRIAPDGSTTPSQAEVAHIGNTVVVLDGMVPVAQAERQAGFPVRQPRDLPSGSRLLGAHVITQAAGTPAEWREVALSYASGDRLLQLTQARNRGVAPVSRDIIGISAVATATDGQSHSTPAATPSSGAVPIEAVPLRQERQPVMVGAAAGTLVTTLRPDGSVLGRTLTWKVGAMTYDLSGPFSPEELLAVARSI